MFASRFLRNVGATGNRFMGNSSGPNDRTMLFGAGGLAALTALVYWAGWKSEGNSKNAREHARTLEGLHANK